MQHFEDFFDHEYDVISQMASLLASAQTQLNNGNISKDEFDELAQGILEFADINELANSIERKAFLKETIDALRFIVEHLPMT